MLLTFLVSIKNQAFGLSIHTSPSERVAPADSFPFPPSEETSSEEVWGGQRAPSYLVSYRP